MGFRMPAALTRSALLVAAASLAVSSSFAQTGAASTDLKYQTPPEVMVKMVDALPTPAISLGPSNASGPRMMLIEQSSSLPTIADLAEPELRLAGLRFNPRIEAPSRTRYFTSLKLEALPVAGAAPKEIGITGLPAKLHVLYAKWSPDGNSIALVNASPNGLDLWIVFVAKAQAVRVPAVRLNAVLTTPIDWLSNGSLAVLAVPSGRGAEPVKSEIPTGPVIQENDGKATPAPTYEDLLKSPTDEAFFAYHATSQLQEVKLGGMVKKLGKPGVFATMEASPDGKYIFTEALHKPFSYNQTYDRFPQRREVYSVATGEAKLLDDAPLIDNLPIDRDAVEPGPRDYGWRADKPATIAWVQAADGGDPKKESAVRDRIFTLDAPFIADPQVDRRIGASFSRYRMGQRQPGHRHRGAVERP
jgi:hypothetical protein